jgi:phage N-6-adenine-methyltransferase
MTDDFVVIRNSDPDAVAIGELYRKAKRSIIESAYYHIECGRRLAEKKASLKHGEWLPWLEANREILGFDTERTAERLVRAAKFDASVEFDEITALEISRQTWGHAHVRGTLGTGENEWFTPQEYVERVRAVLGAIDLDPATHPEAQKVIQASRYFTKAEDGLKQEWRGRVYLNPPYAQPLIAHFVSKMCEECHAGRVTAAIMLTHNYTDTAWFQEAVSVADAICFTRGRVRFYELDRTIAAPTQGQAFSYFGPDPQRFEDVFCLIGACVRPSRNYVPRETTRRA